MMTCSDNLCCGCFACVSSCPQKAISVSEDSVTGFLYPLIDNTACINCGICDSVCDFKKDKITNSNILKAYGLQHKNADVLKNSTSGGAFTAFSDIVLNNNGVVVSSVMKDFHIFHKVASSPEERDEMRGSKYVQSNMNGIYEQIKAHLDIRQQVMFTGTPCQTAAVKSYFGDKYIGRLYIVDFLCHGVPSEKMFNDHISYISEKSGKKCIDYKFRTKVFGWRSHVMEGALFEGNREFKYKQYMQRLYSLFNSGASLRPSCHNCKYKSFHRYSDITIADFWGIDKVAPGKNDGRGHSLVLVNSDAGIDLLNELSASNTAELFDVAVDDIMFRIPQKPVSEIKNSEMFWKTYSEKGYNGILEEYINSTLHQRLRFEMKKILLKK